MGRAGDWLSAGATHNVNAQHGQALVLGLALVAVAGVGLVALYDLGHIALAQSRLTHATDAAAYSGALVQARTLNMLAHVQRAQVGHQVALAHLVTLGAAAQFSDTQRRSHARGNPPGMIIGKLFGPEHRRAYGASRAAPGDARAALRQAAMRHDEIGYVLLADVARALVDGLPAARAAAMGDVLRRNLGGETMTGPAGAAMTWTVSDDTWRDLLVRASGSHTGPDTMRTLIEKAVRDFGYLQPRQYRKINLWSTHPACMWMFHTLKREGSTWMDDAGRWHSMDTQSFHARRYNRILGCYYREYPMGWGATAAKRGALAAEGDAFPDLSREPYWKWAMRDRGFDVTGAFNQWAPARAVQQGWAWPGRGLASWFKLSGKTARPAFTLEVTQAGGSVRSSRNPLSAFRPSAALAAEHASADLRTRARAETYFSSDDPGAKASPLRPQWRARLVADPAAQGGTTLLETLLVMVMLVLVIGAGWRWGQDMHRLLAQDAESRQLAFTRLPALGAAPPSSPAGATTLMRGTALHGQLAGQHGAAAEMRTAWLLEDRGVIGARVGQRSTYVARDSAHHHDHLATQRRMGRSQRAWASAFDRSRPLSERIAWRSQGADSAWNRPGLTLDWLTRWAGRDLGGPGKPGSRPRAVPRPRYRRARRRHAKRWTLTTATVTATLTLALGAMPAARAQCALIRDADIHTARLWPRQAVKQAMHQSEQLLGVLRDVPLNGSPEPAWGQVWFGVPMAMRSFTQRTAGSRAVRELSLALPVLTDVGVWNDTLMVAGSRDQRHWLAQWPLSAAPNADVTAMLSVASTAGPAFELTVPDWLPVGTQWLLHVLTPQLLTQQVQLQAAWHTPLSAERSRRHIARRLEQAGWTHAVRTQQTARWSRRGCEMSVQVAGDQQDQDKAWVWMNATIALK